MKNNDQKNGIPVVENIGPETINYFQRLFRRIGTGAVPAIAGLEKHRGPAAQFRRQAKIISKAAGVSVKIAEVGILLVRANEKLALFDPLSLPWLN